MDALLPRDVADEAAAVGARLRDARQTVAVAESCTGGLLATALTAPAGASDYVRGGVIAYADSVKTAQLGVPEAMLRDHGAVSPEVAAAMADGVRRLLRSDTAVGVTGVAGPGESERKPAGLIFVAVSDAGGTTVERLEGDHGRDGNRVRAVRVALRLLGDRAGVPGVPRRAG